MKLPQDIEGIYREGRTDGFATIGVEPLWLGSAWKKVKKVATRTAKTVGELAWKNKCLGCYTLSNPVAAFACRQACGLV